MSFIFNGVSSDTMKFNVTSRQVYNAPAYDLNAIEVPGRSGDLLNPQNRFKNKQISYTGFLKASDFEGSTWREKLSTGLIQLKGWLCSDAGSYHELTDDYDPGFTRYGYISGETAISDIQDRPFGVTLTVTFNCKPYMYKAGEPMELPETKSASGSIITITDGAENTPLKSAVVNIEPVQDLNGYDYPWPGGGRTNKLNANKATSKVESQITWTVNSDESIAVKGTASSQTDLYFYGGNGVYESLGVPTGTYTLTAFSSNATPSSGFQLLLVDTGGTVTGGNLYATTVSYTVAIDSTKTYRLFLRVQNGTVVDKTLRLQLESGSSASAWTPYSNICPISGWSEVNVWVKPTYDTTLTPTATIPLGQTVYGGTLDVLRGKLVVDRAMVTFDGSESGWSKSSSATNGYYKDMTGSPYYAKANTAFISDKFSYTADRDTYFTTYGKCYCDTAFNFNVDPTVIGGNTLALWKAWLASNPLQVVYELATPQEYDVTPQTIKTLLGTNNIWSDAGEMSIEYPIPAEDPYTFGSRPLYEITMAGTGTLVVNGKEWTITNYTGTLYCDTEAMEWYDASQLRNNIVSGDGWPVFEAGENSVSYTGDITKVMVTPRWRTL